MRHRTSRRPRHAAERPRATLPGFVARALDGVMGAASTLRQAVIVAAVGLLLCSVAPVAFGWTTTVVVSGSMAPAVRPGDVVVASPVTSAEARRVAPGTVLLFDDPTDPGTLLLHRLVAAAPDGRLVTKGDANLVADSTPVAPERVQGRLRLRIPALGLPVVWIRDRVYVPVGALAVVVSIVLFWNPARSRPSANGGLLAAER